MIRTTLLQAAEEAGRIIQEHFNGNFDISSKDTINNLVTEVDKKSEARILEIIKENFPGHFILSEEIGEIRQESDYKWIIDPIDGTVNYAQGIPICCVSIAVEKAGEIIMGAVFNPFLQELFFAEKGEGSVLNDKSISVSGKPHLANACLVTGFPYHWVEMKNDPLVVFERFVKQGLPVRRLGSAAIDLCWVACGRFDAFWEHQLNAWDSAAGFLVVEEAGGKVTDFEGNAYSPYQPKLLATNGKIHDQMLAVIQNPSAGA